MASASASATAIENAALANLPSSTCQSVSFERSPGALVPCEQMHQQAKEELGLDHFEGRSWLGLHHHTLLTMIAFAFLVHRRTNENKSPT